MSKQSQEQHRYQKLIEEVFFKNYEKNSTEVSFLRDDFEKVANELEIRLPKNLGDIIYSFRFRTPLPDSITQLAPQGKEWIIRLIGDGKYRFSLSKVSRFVPNPNLSETKIVDATPGIIKRYMLGDEQALLTQLRYNRLVDIFLGKTCYSLQNHLRTNIPNIGQVETDEIYVGLDKQGVHYIIPVQAKGGRDQLGTVQMEQDFALCQAKFPNLVCIPVAAQFMEFNVIALFSFEQNNEAVSILSEKHYRLVEQDDLTEMEISRYRNHPENE